ncbi:LOW QUALITY PROTEIN: hypothetical protein PHMEG_00027146 [Phytophthora megakarya]|uniref:Peptidase A2 domain-containing protein n=1 Tax=Phytophthora megakarya TaxID=4795 RepID=A0A225V994_9STRA|nr:LOW QUALITY PROTEIN: hypothetical protein PHMEG_00027146 [Phytophthora megakarya]
MSAIDDTRARILLDTGANVSVISAAYAKRLRLREVSDHGRSLEVRGINPGVLETRRRTLVKITLRWERVYEFEMWIMEHSAGVDVVLGTDFMISAGVRLDLFHGTARLPDEYHWGSRRVPRMTYRMEPKSSVDRPMTCTSHGASGASSDCLEKAFASDTRVMDKKDQTNGTDGDGVPQGQACVGPHDERVGRDSSVLKALLCGIVDTQGSAPTRSGVLAYAEERDYTLLQKEKELYECWLAEQPPAVERQEYKTPARILTRPTEDSHPGRVHWTIQDQMTGVVMNSHCSARTRNNSEASVVVGVDEETSRELNTQPTEFSDAGNEGKDPAEDLVDMLELTYISVMQEIEAEIAAGDKGTDDDWYTHIPNEMELADYAHELAFLPDLTEPSSTVLDYTGPIDRMS